MHRDTSMKALVWEAPERMVVRTPPVPDLAPDEVLIRVARAGICGSELSGYLGHNALRVPPLIMGHEFAGTLVGMGASARALNPDLENGQPVTVNPMVYCGVCSFCKRGLNHLCVNRTLIGAHRPGAFAELIAVPARQVTVLPEVVPMATGALTEPVACAVRTGGWAGDVANQPVLIVGAGAIGLLTCQIMQRKGADPVFVSEPNPDRRAVVASLGATVLDPGEQDVVATIEAEVGAVAVAVDAVGLGVTRRQCVGAVRRAGTVILSGLHEEVSEFPAADAIRKEITVQTGFCYTPSDFDDAVALLAEDAISTEDWVVEAPLEEGDMWFKQLIAGEGCAAKVLLVP